MYKVKISENRLVPLEKKRFSDLNFRERDHLQEWIADRPDVLGEELLIVQKEFAGFEDTRERLDLLALDKEGRLVVIENKLDDSGRDVVWQGLKYVAYCSTLKKAEIVEIYQDYLDRGSSEENAAEKLCEFLGIEDLEEKVLNAGNDQRLILVAANFRKEVTATVLWLIGHGVRVQCFRVVPYDLGEDVLIDPQQIIPTPEAEDYMISIADKESEEKSVHTGQKRLEQMRMAFWTKILEELQTRGVARYANISPSKHYWLSSATGMSGCSYNLVFNKKEARVELYLDRSQADNKWIFDQLEREREEIEARFGEELRWQPLYGKKATRISYSHPYDGFNEENWPARIAWLCEHTVKLEKAFSGPLARLNQELKSGWAARADQAADESVPDA